MKKNKGYMVIEVCEDWELILCLQKHSHLPEEGLLYWPESGYPRQIFDTRKLAREAINRTDHYSKAFGLDTYPDKSMCKIVPVI